jgi:serine/threonine protein kinase
MKIASRLDHPGIQRSLDIGATRSRVYMVMEYVEGVTLRQVLHESSPLSVDRTINLAGQLCDAAGYAHARGEDVNLLSTHVSSFLEFSPSASLLKPAAEAHQP